MRKIFALLLPAVLILCTCSKENYLDVPVCIIGKTELVSKTDTSVIIVSRIDSVYGNVQYGFCWSSTDSLPDLNSEYISHENTEIFIFENSIGPLFPGTNYYVRSFTKNQGGIFYSETIHFKTYDERLFDYEGNMYFAVGISDQVWMSTDLKSLLYADGSPIEEVWAFNNNEAYVDEFGRLYTWYAAMKNKTAEKVQGVCPDGWHLPSEEEWQQLERNLGMPEEIIQKTGLRGTNEGKRLKFGGDTGFDATLGGFRHGDNGNFFQIFYSGRYWSSTTAKDEDDAFRRYFSVSYNTIKRATYPKHWGSSVRCLKN